MFESIRYAASYAYSPHGPGEAAVCSRALRVRLKSGDSSWMARYAARVRGQVRAGQLSEAFFGEDVLLIPVPASAIGAGYVSRRLALALCRRGLAGAVWSGLHRIVAVQKSALAWFGERPSVREHYESFAVEPYKAGRTPARIVMVDDVITKGRTLLAAGQRLREAFPGVEIRAFALARTVGRGLDIERLVDPCEGEIRWTGADAYRAP